MDWTDKQGQQKQRMQTPKKEKSNNNNNKNITITILWMTKRHNEYDYDKLNEKTETITNITWARIIEIWVTAKNKNDKNEL